MSAGLYVAAKNGDAAIAAEAVPRVYRWLADAAKSRGVRMVFRRTRTDRLECVERFAPLPWPVATITSWDLAPSDSSGDIKLCLATAEAALPHSSLDDLVGAANLFGVKDVRCGAVIVDLATPNRDHLTVGSVTCGRAVDFYVSAAGSLRGRYERFVQDKAERSPAFRVAQAHCNSSVFPSGDQASTDRLLVHAPSVDTIAGALELMVDLVTADRADASPQANASG